MTAVLSTVAVRYDSFYLSTENSTVQMDSRLLLLSCCSSWCTRRRWWKTRPPACSCWKFLPRIQTWELMARSPSPFTVPTQTSSISTTGQVWLRLFGVKTQVLPLSERRWVFELTIPSALCSCSKSFCGDKRRKHFYCYIFFFFTFPGKLTWHPLCYIYVTTSLSRVFNASWLPVR